MKLTPIRMIDHWVHLQNYFQLKYVSSTVLSNSECFQNCLGLDSYGNCVSDFVKEIGNFMYSISLIESRTYYWTLIFCFPVLGGLNRL